MSTGKLTKALKQSNNKEVCYAVNTRHRGGGSRLYMLDAEYEEYSEARQGGWHMGFDTRQLAAYKAEQKAKSLGEESAPSDISLFMEKTHPMQPVKMRDQRGTGRRVRLDEGDSDDGEAPKAEPEEAKKEEEASGSAAALPTKKRPRAEDAPRPPSH